MIVYLSTFVVLVSIAALIGLGLNFQWGVAGLVNFGVAGFVALGAYATALTAGHIGWLGAMTAAALVSAASSTVLAFLSIRLADDYLAIVTIGFGEISAWRSGTGPSMRRNASTITPSTSRISDRSSSARSSPPSSTPKSSITSPWSRWSMSIELTSPPTAPIRLATAPNAPGRSGR